MNHSWERTRGPYISKISDANYVWKCSNCGEERLSQQKPYPEDIIEAADGTSILSDHSCEDYMVIEIHDE